MYEHLNDDPFLAPETTVSLQFDNGLDDAGEDWEMDDSDVLAHGESDGWARHAARSNGYGAGPLAFDGASDDRPMSLREAIRLVMELS